ncbi:hypothetical protein GN956_G5957 [Arapaima gigas]
MYSQLHKASAVSRAARTETPIPVLLISYSSPSLRRPRRNKSQKSNRTVACEWQSRGFDVPSAVRASEANSLSSVPSAAQQKSSTDGQAILPL